MGHTVPDLRAERKRGVTAIAPVGCRKPGRGARLRRAGASRGTRADVQATRTKLLSAAVALAVGHGTFRSCFNSDADDGGPPTAMIRPGVGLPPRESVVRCSIGDSHGPVFDGRFGVSCARKVQATRARRRSETTA